MTVSRWVSVSTSLVCAVGAVVVPAGNAPAQGVARTAAPLSATPFYDPPTKLPAANGALIRSTPAKLAVTIDLPFMHGPLPGTGTLMMYKSTDNNGLPVAVTGTYIEPSAAWPGPGARPLVSFAEGTQGQGDACAPSVGLTKGVVVTGQSINAPYEIPFIYQLLSKGVAVVVTDYVGLGTTDRLHTYIDRLDQGHAVLDAARAARRLPGTSLTKASKLATYGYSQGGGASASAAELAPSYAPDVPLVGSYAGAPPADLTAVTKGIDGTLLTGAIGWALNGFVQSHAALKPILAANVSPAGKTVLTRLSTMCTADATGAFAFHHTSEWTTSGKSISDVIAGIPVAKALLADERIGRLKPKAPVRISTGTLDDLVPHAQARQLAVDWCARGAKVDYVPVGQLFPTGGTGLNHIGPAVSDSGAAQQWVLDRFAGKPVTGNCSSVASMP